MRTFKLHRGNKDGGTRIVAEGVCFTDGPVVLSWQTKTMLYPNMASFWRTLRPEHKIIWEGPASEVDTDELPPDFYDDFPDDDASEAPSLQREFPPLTDFSEAEGKRCSTCKGTVRKTPSGYVCSQGHGGTEEPGEPLR